MQRYKFLVPLFLLLTAPAALCQTPGSEPNGLQVSKSPFQLRASGIRYDGVNDSPGTHYSGSKLTYKGKLYTESTTPPDGFVVQDLETDSFTIYQPLELAKSARWIRRDKEYEAGNNIWGMQRSNDLIWMGTDGFGVLTFDTKNHLWSRYDIQAEPRPGEEISIVFYADKDYIFVSGFHIYSLKRKSWLRVDAVPTRNVSRFGRSSEFAQAPFDLSHFANQDYLPLNDGSRSILGTPGKTSLTSDGLAYVFEYYYSEEFPTIFRIEKWQLDWAFSQMALKREPDKLSK